MKKKLGYLFFAMAMIFVGAVCAQTSSSQNMPFFMPKNAMIINRPEKLPPVESMGYRPETVSDEQQTIEQPKPQVPVDENYATDTDYPEMQEAQTTERINPLRKENNAVQTAKTNLQSDDKEQVALPQQSAKSTNLPSTQTANIAKQNDLATKRAQTPETDFIKLFGFNMNMDINSIFANVLQDYESDLQKIKNGTYTDNKNIDAAIKKFNQQEFVIEDAIYPQF